MVVEWYEFGLIVGTMTNHQWNDSVAGKVPCSNCLASFFRGNNKVHTSFQVIAVPWAGSWGEISPFGSDGRFPWPTV